MATRIRVSYGVTINCGNFESVRVDVGMERDVQEGELTAAAMRKCFARVKKEAEWYADEGQGSLTGVSKKKECN